CEALAHSECQQYSTYVIYTQANLLSFYMVFMEHMDFLSIPGRTWTCLFRHRTYIVNSFFIGRTDVRVFNFVHDRKQVPPSRSDFWFSYLRNHRPLAEKQPLG
ncbi:hypothetical protein K5D39_13790, partial [Pseudomonas cichorii]|nr:hypothetical protein [Pseudomonas cichorii]